MPTKAGQKGRKIDRNKKWCEAYRNRGQREKNKQARLRRIVALNPNDKCAADALAGRPWLPTSDKYKKQGERCAFEPAQRQSPKATACCTVDAAFKHN